MAATVLATMVDEKVNKAVEKLCKARGLQMAKLIEESLIDKLEVFDDIEDIAQLRKETTRFLADGKL
jgi:hypothetical protein